MWSFRLIKALCTLGATPRV